MPRNLTRRLRISIPRGRDFVAAIPNHEVKDYRDLIGSIQGPYRDLIETIIKGRS